MRRFFGLAAAIAILALTAQAPEAPVGHSGSAVSYTDDSVTLTEKDGKTVTVAMTPGWTVVIAKPVPAASIKPGDFVATANRDTGPDSGTSTELRILNPGYRPENSTHPMGPPAMSMTHGTVAASAATPAGQALTVTFPAGSRHITVPADVKVVGYDVHERDWLKPGTAITIAARRAPDNVYRASRVEIIQK